MLLPVAIFAYNRPDHLRKCLEAIVRSRSEVMSLSVFVYSDGPKRQGDVELVDRVRETVNSFQGLMDLTLIESEQNRGLKTSLERGVTEMVTRFGQVVVVEDDLILYPGALSFFKKALENYADVPEVFQISGYQFPVELDDSPSVGFLPITTSWGWATWERAWRNYEVAENETEFPWSNEEERTRFDFGDSYPYAKMLEAAVTGTIDSWAIHWYASVYKAGGLTCYPATSLVRNEGFDGSGTHCGSKIPDEVDRRGDLRTSFQWPDDAEETDSWVLAVQRYLKESRAAKDQPKLPVSPFFGIKRWAQKISSMR